MQRMVNIKEASKLTGLSIWEIKRGCRDGDYPYIRIGEGRGKFLFDIDLLKEEITRRLMANMQNNKEKENILPFGIRRVM